MTRVDSDLVFAKTDEHELAALDIYHAPDPGAPATIYVHGGGWRNGDKADDGRVVTVAAGPPSGRW